MEFKLPKIINLPRIFDKRGNLSFIEGNNHIPFDIKRAYWIYDVPGGEERGGHTFREQDEFIVALSGSFDVMVDTGTTKKRYSLNRSYFGLHIPAGHWRSMENFSTNALCLILASTHFKESDYIRNYEEFKTWTYEKRVLKDKQVKPSPIVFTQNRSSKSTVLDCTVTELDKNHQEKGNITVIENRKMIPFDLKRVYYLYDVPGGEERGGHAHKELYQLIIAVSGSFDVLINDGENTKSISLNRPYQGLYIVPGIWRELVNFSSGSSCLVLASHVYDENDYIRDYIDFQKFKTKQP